MKGRLRITQPSSPLSILFESLLLQVSESTVLCSSTHSRDRSSFSSSFNFIRVPSLFQCQFYLSLFCSKCHRVQCSSTHSRDRIRKNLPCKKVQIVLSGAKRCQFRTEAPIFMTY